MSRTLPRVSLFVIILSTSCAEDAPTPEPETPESRVAAIVANFPPDGFRKVNAHAFVTHAGGYSQDSVDVWVNDVAAATYLAVDGPGADVSECWSCDPAPAALRFPRGAVLVREDKATGNLAVMARFEGEADAGERSWTWMKREAGALVSGGECWGCHQAFGASDSAIGVDRAYR